MLEDVYTSEYKIKKWVDPTTGKTKERKVRPHRVEFDASKLRGEPSQKDAQGDYGMKEETILEATVKTNHYSWGTLKTVHHGADFSIPLHPEHHQAIAKLKDEQEHKFKDETGRHWVARRKGDQVHFDTTGNGSMKTHVPMSSLKEESEQDLANELHEVLSKDATAGEWIHDFVHSTNPKFEGKTKKERIKMALGAYYGKQNEAYDSPLDTPEATKAREELKKVLLDLKKKSPKHPAVQDVKESGNHDPYFEAQKHKESAETARKSGDDKSYHMFMAAHHDAMAHWSTNRGRYHVADQHIGKAENHQDWANQVKENAPVAPVPDRKYIKGTPEHKAYKATKKPINGMPTNVKEEVELNEANHREFASQGKMHPDMAKHMVVGRNMDFYAKGTGDKLSGTVTKNDGKVVHVRADKDGRIASGDKHVFNISSKLDEAAPMAQKLGVNSRPKSTEVKSTEKSEVPFDQPYTTNTGNIVDKSGAVHTPMSRARDLARKALKSMKEAKYAGLEKEDKPGKIKTALVKLHPNAVEGDTVEGWKDSKQAIKEETDTSEKHEMAQTQLHFIKYAAEEILEYIDMGGQIEEWYQNKLSKVQSEVESLHSYIEGESRRQGMKEEVQKADIPAYLRKAKGEKPLELKDLKRKDTISDPENLARNRGVSEDTKLSYKDFAMMLEYESKEGRYVHKGSYGGSYQDPEGADDADEKKPKQQPAEKRGRGRPAGAKSGARKITGTSKLFK